MDASIDLSDPAEALDLNRIRHQLIRLEDTIVFHLIERAQFPLNKSIYQPGAVTIRDASAADSLLSFLPRWLQPQWLQQQQQQQAYSFMDWYLSQQETLQSRIRRFESPDEYPFFPDAVQWPILKPLNYPAVLHPNNVNANDRIKQYYVDVLLPAVCPDFGHGDRGETQENYGSSATCDIACLQALSRRIHFGKFVAESKFRAETAKFTALIRAGDREGLGDAIVNKKVEQMVLQRMRRKVETFGQDISADSAPAEAETAAAASSPSPTRKINVDAVVELYEKFVIPVTKDVEVEYLMQRLDEPPADPWYAARRRRQTQGPHQQPAPTTAETLVRALAVGGGALLVVTAALRWLPRR